MEKEWTTKEVHGFLEWDYKRKNKELGSPVHFKTVPELFAWLKSHEKYF